MTGIWNTPWSAILILLLPMLDQVNNETECFLMAYFSKERQRLIMFSKFTDSSYILWYFSEQISRGQIPLQKKNSPWDQKD